jgi:hypothetical protein
MREVNTLQDCLNRRAYKQALVYLWEMANAGVDGGGTVFSTFWKRNYERSSHAAMVDDLEDWLDAGCPIDRDLKDPATARALSSALDRLLSDRIANAPFTAFVNPVTSPSSNEQFWLLPRRRAPGLGYLYNEPPGALYFFHPNHVILPVVARQLQQSIPIRITQTPPVQEWPATLRAAIAAFDDDIALRYESRGSSVLFTGTTDDAIRLQAARELIARAELENAHILLFPELTLSPDNQRCLRQELDERRRAGNPSKLLLIGLGSFHEIEHSDQLVETCRNRATLVSGRDGRVLLYQDKFQAASGANVIEDFQPAAGLNALLLPIGILVIAICKDLFDEQANWLWPVLTPEWLLSPSMSDELERHREKSADLWKRNRCVSVVANQPFTPGKPDCRGYIQQDKVPQPATADLHIVDIGPPARPLLRVIK